MKDLVIYGTGGVGRQVQQIVADINAERRTWNLLGFLDDDKSLHGKDIGDVTVLGDLNWLTERPNCYVVAAVGSPKVRRAVVEKMERAGQERFATIIHPDAWIGARTTIEAGCVVYPRVALDTDVTIGAHVILNKNCTIGHDTILKDYITVGPGVNIGGMVRIGTGCDIGISSATIQSISIGPWSIVGAGAVVIRDVPAETTVVGVPAKPIER